MQVLEGFMKRIGIVGKIADFEDRRERLKDYINDIMLSP
jgi:hypothetical protein